MKTSSTADFLRDFNAAFFSGNQQFIEQHVTDDVEWIMVGATPLKGKQALVDAAFGMQDYTQLDFDIDMIIAEGREGAVKGVMTATGGTGRERKYCYSDFYEMTGDAEPRIQKMTSFVVEIKKES
ncbi:nuclear transport factor 2 family protein [Planococcus sp. ISL-109]|uniref:nuclear transport factor 2 family protein n=1 Tax=Planococcus sp. ISL-109 TaxID=2819166 RepID=UPI001BEC915B|nr:nuclear transport factor 2 family protein [Planococcus sp. ISL-109]MBT2582182.1 nuclear transport factor 2 family protein [Planococcus sp. ISL-109]